jgi:hypothetical protein
MSNLRFRYVKDKDRIIWTEGVYPQSHHFLNLIRSVPWKQYKAHLASYITQEDQSNSEGFSLNSGASYVKVEGTAFAKKSPYRIFGGAACEILNAFYPKSGRLHNTTDPTIDIDVLIEPPMFIVDDELEYDYQYAVYRKNVNKLAPIADHYMNWLFDRVLERLPEIALQFKNNSSFQTPLPEDTPETAIGIRHSAVGPFLLTLLITDAHLIKIQITTTYLGITDHLVEFVMVGSEDFEVKDNSETMGMPMGDSGIVIENPLKLLASQIEGLVGRQEADEETKYKLINHYGRTLYLVKAIRWLVDNKFIEVPYWGKFNELLKAVNAGVCEKEGVCPLPVGCSLRAIIEPIRPFVQKAPGWGAVLKRLNVVGGTRKRRVVAKRKSRKVVRK